VPAFYTKTREVHPVFHTTPKCDEAQKIERPNYEGVVALAGRELCEECAKIEAKKAKKAAKRERR